MRRTLVRCTPMTYARRSVGGMASPYLTTDRMQPFYLVVRTYLRLLVVAGLVSYFSFRR